MSAKGPIYNPKGPVIEAIGHLNSFAYRKEFGLSHEEFIKEPLEAYIINTDIMNIKAEIERRQQKQLERKAKR